MKSYKADLPTERGLFGLPAFFTGGVDNKQGIVSAPRRQDIPGRGSITKNSNEQSCSEISGN